MMSENRNELQSDLCQYAKDTLTSIQAVKEFCEKFSKWEVARENEITTMTDIKSRADILDMSITDVAQSENRRTAFQQYMRNTVNTDSKRAELEKELAEVLKDTLGGLENLDCFLDAVEKLAVTSVRVLTENQVLHLPEGISFEHVQVIIKGARLIRPLLLEFKRDAKVFFTPKLQNIEVFKHQLHEYIQTSKKICEKLQERSFSHVCLNTTEAVVDLNMDLSEDDIQKMLYHIYLLHEIRRNSSFRMVFLFKKGSCQDFICRFDERHPKMLQFLKDLEECAVQLNRMKKGAKISSVAGSSVGAVGGVLSIVGLALIPFTAGISFGLTMAGVGLGITSGVNSIVTSSTEIGINHKHQKKAGKVFQSFMEDVQNLQDCLQEVANQKVSAEVMEIEGLPVTLDNLATTKQGSLSIVGSALCGGRMLQYNRQIMTSAGRAVVQDVRALRNTSRVASEIPEIGQATVRGSIAVSRSARAGFITLNALFLGMDIAIICKDSMSLANGSETKVSQFLRARAALWRSEIDSWQKIHDSLKEALPKSKKNLGVLEMPFYPERVI